MNSEIDLRSRFGSIRALDDLLVRPARIRATPVHLCLIAFLAFAVFGMLPGAWAVQIDLAGPAGSGQFGKTVTVLSNGNFVVTDPGYDAPGPIGDVGAAYLYDGVTLTVISTLTGSTAGDRVGDGGITVLSNGHYLVHSHSWNGMRGAVTWGSRTAGVQGVVSAANSLVGSTANDRVGSFDDGENIISTVTALTNGNYVVSSSSWNGSRGAVTWGNGTNGVKGAVSAANSLVGSLAGDAVGSGNPYDDVIVVLNNGHYVVSSPYWNNRAGAVTWGSGTNGVTGAVSAANSLVGSAESDSIGLNGVTPLNNGNYVVCSPIWNNGTAIDAGAVTWGSGTNGVKGAVSVGNSLVGGKALDRVGDGGLTALINGNYVVSSTHWGNSTGAVTWGSGTKGVTGVVSGGNSLINLANVGITSVIPLSNGNYVVCSPYWNNHSYSRMDSHAGAVTWGNGVTGVAGPVSAANSLIGGAYGYVGDGGVTALNNGNYVVSSTHYGSAGANFGAVTWGNGTIGTTGTISPGNSLVGSTPGDQVGTVGYYGGITPLNNGNYVVRSPHWHHGGASDAGAMTWGSGTTGVTGSVSAANSLVGSSVGDNVGSLDPTLLNNGNYVVCSPDWNSGAVSDAGAVTWCSGTTGRTGAISAANSLVGSKAGDQVGNNGVTPLKNGNYVVSSLLWDNGAAYDAGAVTWGSGTSGVTGPISAHNSLIGRTAGDRIGSSGVSVLNNGNYVVNSGTWDNGTSINAGAVTCGNGTNGVTGAVSATNSLVGSMDYDTVGSGGVTALNNGSYVICSSSWNNGPATVAGAVTWGGGTTGVCGTVSAANSVLGTVPGGGSSMTFAYDLLHNRLLVGYPSGNRVSIFVSTPVITIAMVPAGVRLLFSGEPGFRYEIQRGPAVTGPWNTIATLTAPASGQLEYIAPSPPGVAFYRTVQP